MFFRRLVVHYRGISKRIRNIAGLDIAFTRFHGKAPGLFAEGKYTRGWNTFLTKSENTAEVMHGRVQYVFMSDGIEHGTPVAKWNGQATMADGFWDKNIVGHVQKHGHGKYSIQWLPEYVEGLMVEDCEV